MKKLHLIKTKNIAEIDIKNRSKVLPLLEKEVLDWANNFKSNAYKATCEVRRQLEENPCATLQSKYFKYLRRLLELKFEKVEQEAYKNGVQAIPLLEKDLYDFLNIESVRIPEHLSCSSMSMYEFCPRRWYYRYALGIKTPPTAPLHMGSAIDDALNFYFEEKIKGNKAPLSAVHAQFHERFAKGEEEVVWGNADPKRLKSLGPTIINKYISSFDRITNPTEVQAEIRIPIENGYFTGFIDILEEDAIIDTKTAAKPWEETGPFAKHLKELQPKAYSLWYLEKNGKMPKEFRYQIVTKDDDPQTQLISFELKKFELESFRDRVERVWKEIHTNLPYGKEAFDAQAIAGSGAGRGVGKELPSALCSREWCDMWQYCKKDGLDIPVKWVSKKGKVPGYHIYEDGSTR